MGCCKLTLLYETDYGLNKGCLTRAESNLDDMFVCTFNIAQRASTHIGRNLLGEYKQEHFLVLTKHNQQEAS